MTVASEINKSGPYNGNGSTTVFAYGFRILDEAHITVVRTVDGVDTILTTGFTISGVGASGGGNVTFSVAPTVGQTVTLIRNVPFTQQTDLENQGAYFAETVEEAFDLAAMRDQQLAEEMSRALKIPVGEDASVMDTLAANVIRLADSADAIDTVAGIEADVTTVAGIADDVSTVADLAADVTNFADVYLGPHASAPALRNDGSPLMDGDIFFDTVESKMKVWNGVAWQPSASSVNGTLNRQVYTATGGQTDFNATYDVGFVDVWLNGVKLVSGDDFTASNGTTIVLTSGATAGDVVDILSFGTFSLLNPVFSGQVRVDDGTAAAPSLTNTGDTNTGVFFPAADTVAVATGGAERLRVDSSGNVGVGVTPSAWASTWDVVQNQGGFLGTNGSSVQLVGSNSYSDGTNWRYVATGAAANYSQVSGVHSWSNAPSGTAGDAITFTQAMMLDASGNLLIAHSTAGAGFVGVEARAIGLLSVTRDGGTAGLFNRLTSDGTVIEIRQDTTVEGSISVSGTTVSYNGGHLSRWAQFPDNSRPELLKGTVMSNLDQMSNWDNEDNEQLNCVQVSDVEGDANVAGVFVAWDTTDDEYNDILLAMTGDMVIRIGAGTTVNRGDLLMSAGDGTAKPQDDDIIRAKTIAKVTSTHVSHTYADGSYAVPCVLMAC